MLADHFGTVPQRGGGARRPDRRAGAHRQPARGRNRPDRQRPGRRDPLRRAGRRGRLRGHRDDFRRGECRRGNTSAAPYHRESRYRSRRSSARGAQLRMVELRRPRSVIARNTVEALQSGMVFGVASQVDGIVARMIDELEVETAEVSVVATGYLAPLVVRRVPLLHRARAVAHAAGPGAGVPAQLLTAVRRKARRITVRPARNAQVERAVWPHSGGPAIFVSETSSEPHGYRWSVTFERQAPHGTESPHHSRGRPRRWRGDRDRDLRSRRPQLRDRPQRQERCEAARRAGPLRRCGPPLRRSLRLRRQASHPGGHRAPARSATGPAPTVTRCPTAAGSRPTYARPSRPRTSPPRPSVASLARPSLATGRARSARAPARSL